MASRGWITIPVIVILSVLMQGTRPLTWPGVPDIVLASQVLNNYTLVWWQTKWASCLHTIAPTYAL